jgi:hypothetical protein
MVIYGTEVSTAWYVCVCVCVLHNRYLLDKPIPGAGDETSASTSFTQYMLDARKRIKASHTATRRWAFPWNGVEPGVCL